MKKVILCTMTRNHLRFLIPIIKTLCDGEHEVLLYTNFGEIVNDTLSYKIDEFSEKYENFYVLDLSDEKRLIQYSIDANSMLVTSGTSNVYHSIDYNLCKKVKCKTFAIQHGLSQEGITRCPEYHFSADHVLTWVKGDNILKDATTPKEKFIPVGVPDHYYDEYNKDKAGKIFFFTSFFDVDNSEDEKISRGIYTEQWKDETWNHINELCSGDTLCYFVRHPAVERNNLHLIFRKILKRENKVVIDNQWLKKNSIKRSELYSFGSEYYVTYPSSCFIDCLLNDLDYNLFVDYNGNIDILSKDSLESLNATNKICNLLLS
tara:strand:+ start:674 stop:1630 length:957 start_codon:yes stop_codon:yes gene_type:complete